MLSNSQINVIITGPPTHSVGSQTSNGSWCLSSSSSSVVCNATGGAGGLAAGRCRASRRARWRWSGRHCTACQYAYVPL